MDRIHIDGPIQNIHIKIGQLSFEVEDLAHVSDGYHTIQELYDHRCLLYIALLDLLGASPWNRPWKSKLHGDGTMYEGWFVAGMTLYSDDAKQLGQPISYHLPLKYWDLCNVTEYDSAPHWDGHTSADVLKRLEDWLK